MASLSAVQWLLEPSRAVPLAVGAVVLLAVGTYFRPADPNRVPVLTDTIPYLTNTYQYMTDMRTFLWRTAYVSAQSYPVAPTEMPTARHCAARISCASTSVP